MGKQGHWAIRDTLPLKSYELFTEMICISMWRMPTSGIPSSWPGYDLDIGASGNKVRQIQEQLNTIAEAYPAVPVVTADGIYGPETQNSVRIFQMHFRSGPDRNRRLSNLVQNSGDLRGSQQDC